MSRNMPLTRIVFDSFYQEARLKPIGMNELLRADEVFLVNSVIGVWQIAECECKTWTTGSLTAQIRRWIDDAQDR